MGVNISFDFLAWKKIYLGRYLANFFEERITLYTVSSKQID